MKIKPIETKKDKTEISIQKKQQLEKYRYKGVLKPKPNQRIFKLDLYKKELSECEYFFKSNTVSYSDVLNRTIPENRSILIKEGYDYVIALNYKGALKRFNRTHKGIDIKVIKNSLHLNKSSKINMLVN